MLELACEGDSLLSCVNEVHATAAYKLAKVKLYLLSVENEQHSDGIEECVLLLKSFIVLLPCFTLKTAALDRREKQARRMIGELTALVVKPFTQ
jgi:hypothetical protein